MLGCFLKVINPSLRNITFTMKIIVTNPINDKRNFYFDYIVLFNQPEPPLRPVCAVYDATSANYKKIIQFVDYI